MKNIFKILSILLVLTGMVNYAQAGTLNELIKNSELDKTSVIAVSVKDVQTGNVIYQYNEKKLLHPASTLKVFSTFPAMDVLGSDYIFKTGFYVYNNDLYVKLGADPFLTSLNIKDAVKSIKSKGYKQFNNVYFDDSIMDNVEWGVGWMWDDGTNPLMQKYSAYNLDNNLITLDVKKNENGAIEVNNSSAFTMPVLNAVKAGKGNNVYAVRHDWISPDIICVTGTLADKASVKVPINNMRGYFQKRLFYYLNHSNIKIANKSPLNGQTPDNAKKIEEILNVSYPVLENILKNSDNKAAETYAKLAGGVKYNSQANLANQIRVFYDYWRKNGVNTSEIVVADASGVSRNNLLNVDFMTNALNKLYAVNGEEKMKNYLAQPGEGTLKNRLLNHRGRLYLKTGTLSNVSGITGYVITSSGKTYSVAILIQNFLYPSEQVKFFENDLLTAIEKM